MAGLIEWRHDLGDPREDLGKAVDLLERAVQLLPGVKVWDGVPIPAACFLSFLLDRDGTSLRNALPKPEERSKAVADVQTHLEADLLRSFDGEVSEEDSSRVPRSRSKVLVASYQTYRDLLHCPPKERAGLVAQAESNFLGRRKDSWFSGGVGIYGGGLNNDTVVDFVLAAVLKKNGASDLSKVHGWRW